MEGCDRGTSQRGEEPFAQRTLRFSPRHRRYLEEQSKVLPDELAKLVILFYASFFAGVIVMYEGVSQITPLYIRVAQTLGAGEFEIFRKVIIPLTVPHILTALRVALGVAWATLVASELIAAQRGLGAMIQNASTYFLLDVIYVGIICIGCIALIMDLILRRISARLLVWQERAVA